jgi:hypothetical protein
MRIDNGKAAAGGRVLKRELLQERGFAHAGLADDVKV